MSARNAMILRRLLAPTIGLADTVAGPPAGSLTALTVYEYTAACRDAAGNYSPRASVVKQGTPDANGALLLGVTVPISPCTLVIWRGAAGGAVSAPSAYLDVPVDSARIRVYDTGLNLNAVAWKTTSIPTVPSSSTNQTFHGIIFPATGMIDAHGSGTPEGALTAPIGSRFTRTDGGVLATLYIKESGSGAAGWVAK